MFNGICIHVCYNRVGTLAGNAREYISVSIIWLESDQKFTIHINSPNRKLPEQGFPARYFPSMSSYNYLILIT